MAESDQQALGVFTPEIELGIDDYAPFVGHDRVDELKRLAEPVQGKSWANINSTFIGGGVAEMLRSAVPLARDLGIDAQWYTINGNNEFFGVTKKFHNMLQGVSQPISLEEIFQAYLGTIDRNATDALVASDMVIVHDPQPAALVMNGVMYGNVIWRCHIDTSSPDHVVWRFLLPYINMCAGAVFTMPQFVGQGVTVPTYQIMPCIDPLAQKNRQYDEKQALEILSPLFHEHDIDPNRPIVAAISRYDVHKNQATILEAFNRMRRERRFRKPPYLIFLGNTATDDPEGEAMLQTLKETCGDDIDVRFWVNVEDNDRVVGALMHLAKVFVHISTKEGFGLVVSEALWQGTPVIGSTCGGITKQVIDGTTGYTVDPGDVDAVASRMAELLEEPEQAIELGRKGREHVRQNFLLPELVRRYVTLLRFLTEVDNEPPPFRMNGLSYSEVQSASRRRLPTFR